MSASPNDVAGAAAEDFARGTAALWQARLGTRLLGVYLIGSLAHGGFNRRYSDIDMAIVAEDELGPFVRYLMHARYEPAEAAYGLRDALLIGRNDLAEVFRVHARRQRR